MSEWISHLRQTKSFAARLVPAGRDVVSVAANDKELSQFIERLCARDRSLAVDGLDLVVGGYGQFLANAAPALLDELRSSRTNQVIEVGPAIVGKPIWQRTVQSWISGRLPPARYISQVATKTFDLPENLAFRCLVEQLHRDAAKLAFVLKDSLHPTILQILKNSERLMRDPLFSLIPPNEGPSERIVVSAEGSRDAAYRQVGRLLRRRTVLSSSDDLARWRRAALAAQFGNEMLLPISQEDIFELLALSLTLDKLEYDLGFGPPLSFWMRIGTKASAGPVARFMDVVGGVVDVYFDRTPSFLSDKTTRYQQVFATHENIGASSGRRPDVVVSYVPHLDRRRILFVEAKLPGPENAASYIRNSIYKVFGYLYDFRDLWHEEQLLRSVLFVPIDSYPKSAASDCEMAVISARRGDLLAEAFSRALNRPIKRLADTEGHPPVSEGAVPLQQ